MPTRLLNGHATQILRPQGQVLYNYDAAGNLKQIAAPANTVNYTYDALNRLHTVQETTTGTTAYGY